jgi:hypothetical protein
VHKWYYTYAGLRVASDLELPEWESFMHIGPYDQPDVLIRVDVAQSNELSAAIPEPIISADEYCFFMPEVGAYRIVNGKEIIVSPVSQAGQNELRLFLLGSAWGALCYQRGLFAVHASAVQVGNEAVLFCATQGKGKSTMTAWLAARGHALVSDDLCCINMPSQDQPSVYPSTQRFRLWNDALEALGWNSDLLERDHFRLDKFLFPWTGKPLLHPLPLRAIYLLGWGEFNLQRLTGMNALQRFVSQATYRGELLNQMGLSGTYWQRCLNLLQKVPVWELTRKKDLTMMNNTAKMLEQHWACDTEQ